MIETILMGFPIRLGYAVFMALVVYMLLRIFDRLSGQDFKKNMEKISNDSQALANYYGYRLIAISVGMGLLFS